MDVRLYETDDVEGVVCQLTDKLYDQGQRVLIVCDNLLTLQALDQKLWQFQQLSFLPHMTDVDPVDCKAQPILLTTKFQNLNDADTLIVCNVSPDSVPHCTSLVGVFAMDSDLKKTFVTRYQPSQHFKKLTAGGWEKQNSEI